MRHHVSARVDFGTTCWTVESRFVYLTGTRRATQPHFIYPIAAPGRPGADDSDDDRIGSSVVKYSMHVQNATAMLPRLITMMVMTEETVEEKEEEEEDIFGEAMIELMMTRRGRSLR